MDNLENQKLQDQIEGRNSVIELLKSGKDINKLYVQEGKKYATTYR